MFDPGAIQARSHEVYAYNRIEGAVYTPHRHMFRTSFNWDNGMAMLGLAAEDPHHALDILSQFTRFQHSNGMIPNEGSVGQMNWFTQRMQEKLFGANVNSFMPEGTVTSAVTQPPLITIAAREAGMALPETERIERWKEVFPALKRQAEWFMNERTDPEDGLIFSPHAFETGMDNTGPWRNAMAERWLAKGISRQRVRQALALTAMGPSRNLLTDGRYVPIEQRADNHNVLVNLMQTRQLGKHGFMIDKILADPNIVILKDCGMNPIVARSNTALQEMAKAIHSPEYDIQPELQAWMDRLETAINTELWSDDLQTYVSKNMRTNKLIPMQTIGSLHALLINIPDARAKILLQDFQDPEKFGGDCPSMPYGDFHIERGYWMGAIWPFSRVITMLGLLNHGMESEAEQLAHKILSRPSEPVKSEQDHSRTGEPLGISQFLPTAAMDLYLLQQQNLV